MSDNSPKRFTKAGPQRFATTHWSVVLAAASPSSPNYEQALNTLCQTYWFPLYAYLRRRGCDRHQAEDYTQAFFARLLEKHSLRLADPKQGKFRSFLLAALKNFVANELARARAQKRGGNRRIVSLDIQDAESRYAVGPADQLSPEQLFDRSWALTVLERTMARLQDEAVGRNKQKLFEHVKTYLTAEKSSAPYRDAASDLGMTEGAVKVAVHRLRKRYRELLRDEIAQTVAGEDQVDEEIRDLFAALSC
jgi:RNA polymerase sigma factor (sigma-70 family)